MFKPGESLYYPAVGVGIVEDIVQRSFGTEEKSFYRIIVIQKRATVMVPVDDFARVGIRPIVDNETMLQIFSFFKELPDEELFQGWTKRFRTYEERLKSADPFEIAEIFRDLMLQSKRKELSFGERRVLESARQLVVQELSCCTARSESEIQVELDDQMDELWTLCEQFA